MKRLVGCFRASADAGHAPHLNVHRALDGRLRVRQPRLEGVGGARPVASNDWGGEWLKGILRRRHGVFPSQLIDRQRRQLQRHVELDDENGLQQRRGEGLAIK